MYHSEHGTSTKPHVVLRSVYRQGSKAIPTMRQPLNFRLHLRFNHTCFRGSALPATTLGVVSGRLLGAKVHWQRRNADKIEQISHDHTFYR
jgi:hypothetical protein